MATTKERILVTLTPDLSREIQALAKHQKTPKATIAAQLMQQAIDDNFERYMYRVSVARLESTKRWLKPDEFWTEVEKRAKKK